MKINSDLIFSSNGTSIDEIVNKVGKIKFDTLFDGQLKVNAGQSGSGTLSASAHNYDILFFVVGAGAEVTTVPMAIYTKTATLYTFVRCWSNIPTSYNSIDRITISASTPTRFTLTVCQATNWTDTSVFKVYGLKIN